MLLFTEAHFSQSILRWFRSVRCRVHQNHFRWRNHRLIHILRNSSPNLRNIFRANGRSSSSAIMVSKFIAYHFENRVELGEVQALKKYVVGYFVALLNGVSRTESTLISIGSPRRPLVNKFLVVCLFGKAVALFINSCSRESEIRQVFASASILI